MIFLKKIEMEEGLGRNTNKAFFDKSVYSGPNPQGSLKFSNFRSSTSRHLPAQS